MALSRTPLIASGLALPLVAAIATAAPAPLIHAPTLAGDSVIFVHADELWRAPVTGGRAMRLTTIAGRKLNAKASPDGAFVAFTMLAGGNIDVYVMPAQGGEPVRLTYHPAYDRLVGWTPDGGAVLFTSRRHSILHPIDKLFSVARGGGAAERLPLTEGGPAAFSPDGKRLAVNRSSPESWLPWRGYRGGRHAAIAIHELASHRETVIAPGPANDVFPMWDGDAIYFASDRDGRMNLYRYEPASQALRQLTHYRDADVRQPSLGRGRIVYELAGRLHVYELATGRDEAPAIAIDEPLPQRAVRRAAIAPYLTSFDIAPDGTRALISARGELIELSSDGKGAVDLTRTSGIREHGGVYSPDGRQIAFVSDRSGEYEIHVRGAGGGPAAAPRQLTRLGPGFRQGLRWSPDGKRLLFTDQTWSLHALDIATGARTRIDGSRNAAIECYDWTADSAAVIYARTDDNQLGRLVRYRLARGVPEPLGDGMTDDASPAVGGAGDRRVYFLSARHLRTSFSDFEQTFHFDETIGIYAMSLDAPDPTKLERLPVEPGALSRLTWIDGRLLYLARDRRKGTQALHAFDLARRQDSVLADGVVDYRATRGAVVVLSGERLTWLWPGTARRSDVELGPLTVEIDPAQEWRQIFVDAWRLERDYFHEPTMHGVDWRAMRARYEPLVPGAGSREDLNALISEMVGELGTSHAWAFDGDMPELGGPPVGVLGGELVADRARYRVARVFRGDASAPETRSPLAVAGVKPGEFVLAIDGHPLTTAEDISARLVGSVGKELTATVAATPAGGGARSVKLTPVRDDMAARYLDWVADNRARVARATHGRCGYIHVPSTRRDGIAAFARQFFAQIDREAVIIDIRWNAGGLFPASMIEHLARRPLAVFTQRHGNAVRVPGAAIAGPKVLLTNRNTVSGGDNFAAYFRAAGLGPIIGGRTEGAVVGNVTMPQLVDNGELGVPALAHAPGAAPAVENIGVVPDLEVEPALIESAAEPDPQLAAAIAAIVAGLPAQRATGGGRE